MVCQSQQHSSEEPSGFINSSHFPPIFPEPDAAGIATATAVAAAAAAPEMEITSEISAFLPVQDSEDGNIHNLSQIQNNRRVSRSSSNRNLGILVISDSSPLDNDKTELTGDGSNFSVIPYGESGKRAGSETDVERLDENERGDNAVTPVKRRCGNYIGIILTLISGKLNYLPFKDEKTVKILI